MDLGRNKPYEERTKIRKISNSFAALQARVGCRERENAALKQEKEDAEKKKKRRALPNPNRKFMTRAQMHASEHHEEQIRESQHEIVVDEAEEDEVEEGDDDEDIEDETPAEIQTRSGRVSRRRAFYDE